MVFEEKEPTVSLKIHTALQAKYGIVVGLLTDVMLRFEQGNPEPIDNSDLLAWWEAHRKERELGQALAATISYRQDLDKAQQELAELHANLRTIEKLGGVPTSQLDYRVIQLENHIDFLKYKDPRRIAKMLVKPTKKVTKKRKKK